MAIKRKEEGTSLPATLRSLLKKAFSLQALRDAYDDAYKGASGDLKSYFKSNDDGFDVSYGKGAGFSCDEGAVQISLGKSYETDVDAIIELVNSGKITLTSLLGAVSFSQTKLETVLGSHYATCVKAVEKPDVTITLRGSKEFKEQFAAQVGDVLAPPAAKPEPTPAPEAPAPKRAPRKPAAPKAEDSLARAKAAAAAAKAKAQPAKSADADLDDILGKE